jgi:23S rRNA pseudouridine2605 synthase
MNPKKTKKTEKKKAGSGSVRLNKFIAAAGIASRRGADELISAGRVTVNGQAAALGTSVDPKRDHVKLDGKLIAAPVQTTEHVYILLNKPTGYICSLSDPSGRPLVTDLIREHRGRRLYPVGRLDFNSEGLIILTDDGDFAARVSHPSTGPLKTYHVRVRGVPTEKQIERLTGGVTIEGRKARAERAKVLRSRANAWLEVTLKEGRNRQLRKMLDALGHPVVKLRRVAIGPLASAGMRPGDYRNLTEKEIRILLNE